MKMQRKHRMQREGKDWETGMNDQMGKMLTSLLGVRTMMKKRTSCEFLPMFAACFSRAMAT